MREYGKLYSGFWTSQDIQSMSDDAKVLAAYLLTCDHSTLIGCFRLPDGYVTDDLNWGCERVSKGFDELSVKGFATRDNGSKWVVIHKYIKWNQPENPNQMKAAVKAFNQVPVECGVKQALARSLKEYCDGFDIAILEPFINPCGTVTKPVAVTVEVSVTEAVAGTLPAGEPASPESDETALQAACRKTWNAYDAAYAQRYGVKPVRNAKVSSQLKQFVKRIGFEESPQVAAFFVSHANSFYIRKSHDVGSLLADAEKLRMEWATGRMVTVSSAQQVDKTQSNFNAANEAIRMLEAEGVQ